jgi:hypothetical protein
MRQPPCKPDDVRATASTKAIVGGVAGVITLDGTHCALHITRGPTRLLDASGHELPAALDATTPKVNPPENPRPDLALADGHALWGFTWTGSWCGPAAASVVVPMTDDPTWPDAAGPYGDLHVPLSGPAPTCTGSSHAVLRPGVAGRPAEDSSPAEAVLPAPPSWAGLEESLSIPATVSNTLPPYTLTLTNPTETPITLSPCPAYGYAISVSRAGKGYPSAQDSFGPGSLPCPSRSQIDPYQSVTLTLPGVEIDAGSPTPYPKGSLVTVEVAIAGVATAKAVAHVG